MNQINEPANDNYDFGLDFNYAVWNADTDITLTNVPWDNNYRDVVQFANTNALNQYIDSHSSENTRITNASYAKADQPISLDIPFNSAQRFNYIRVYNPAQPVQQSVGGLDIPRYFYYFITNVRYVAPNTTEVIVQLDVYQTYIRSVRFGRCYVERGHLGIANQDGFRNYGRDYLTVPEGLDTGNSYNHVLTAGESQLMIASLGGYSILVVATGKLEASPGNSNDPNLESAEGGLVQGLPTGASAYLFVNANDFLTFMRNYSKVPWVTQSIISITVIPPSGRYFTSSHLGAKLPIGAYKMPSVAANKPKRNLIPNWRNNQQIINHIPARYRHLRKLWTYPYMAVEVTNMVNQSSIYKPELINSDNIYIEENVALMPPSQRLSFHIDGYNSPVKVTSELSESRGAGHEHAVNIGNLPSLPIVNDGAILAMASSAHTTAFGHQSADWSQQKAMRSGQVGYDQASAGINAATDLAAIGMNADASSTGIANQLAQDSAMLNLIGGTASGAGMGAFAGPLGAVAGGIGGAASGVMGLMNTGNQVNASNAQLANRLSSGQAASDTQSGVGGYMRDTNKALSDWAARGDYESAIAGLNARSRDMELTPPSMAGQSGGELLGVINYRFGYLVRVMMPDQASIQTVGEYWLRYGYSVNRFMFLPSSLQVMDKFTYWKLKETYIGSSPVPEGFKQAIRGIFEKGVTVWANPDDMGYIDPAENKPLSGIAIDGYRPPVVIPDPDPEPPTPVKKKRNKKMIVYGTVSTTPGSAGNLWALAGTSPGTMANWIETQDNVRRLAFIDATGQDDAVGVTETEFLELRTSYLSPVEITNPGAEPGE